MSWQTSDSRRKTDETSPSMCYDTYYIQRNGDPEMYPTDKAVDKILDYALLIVGGAGVICLGVMIVNRFVQMFI